MSVKRCCGLTLKDIRCGRASCGDDIYCYLHPRPRRNGMPHSIYTTSYIRTCSGLTTRGDFCKNRASLDGRCKIHSRPKIVTRRLIIDDDFD